MKIDNNIKMRFLGKTASLILFATFFAVSCNNSSKKSQDDVSAEDVQEDVSEAVNTSKEYLEEEKEEIYSQYQEQLNEAEEKLETLGQKIDASQGDVKQEFRVTLDSIEAEKNQLQTDVDRLKESSGDAWGELKEGIDESMGELKNSIEDAESEFDNEEHSSREA